MEEKGGNVGAAWSGSGGGEFVIEENKKQTRRLLNMKILLMDLWLIEKQWRKLTLFEIEIIL